MARSGLRRHTRQPSAWRSALGHTPPRSPSPSADAQSAGAADLRSMHAYGTSGAVKELRFSINPFTRRSALHKPCVQFARARARGRACLRAQPAIHMWRGEYRGYHVRASFPARVARGTCCQQRARATLGGLYDAGWCAHHRACSMQRAAASRCTLSWRSLPAHTHTSTRGHAHTSASSVQPCTAVDNPAWGRYMEMRSPQDW